MITVTKKPLFLVNLRKFLKGILSCFRLQILYKGQNKSSKTFHLKDNTPTELMSGLLYKF